MNARRLHNILMVSDDQARRRVDALALRAAASWTVVSCDLAEALLNCEMRVMPDLIVLDVDTDERPALAVLALLRQRTAQDGVPVVLLAAVTGPAQRERYLARGAADVIAKPYIPMALASQLEAAFAQADGAPRVPAPARDMKLTRPATEIGLLRVLIVEDEPLQRALLAAALRQAGVQRVSQAGDGAEALATLGAGADCMDLVITDVRMTGMDGIAFLRAAGAYRVRAFALSSAIEAPLLAATEAVVRANGIKLLGVLPKPVEPAQLLALLAACTALELPQPAVPARAPQPAWTREALAAGLAQGQFIPFFQPKFTLANQRLAGVEVLARWLHPDLGLLPPSQFIATMEEEGLIDALTDAMLTQALACLRNWDERGWRLDLALNLSHRTLVRQDLPSHLQATVAAYGIGAERITFEVSETAVNAHRGSVLETLTRLRLLRFELAMDDFGLGDSSLAQLSAMPFTEIKIDRSLVAGMHAGATRAMAESALALAAALGLRTVAEGIEAGAERDALLARGCVLGQGYWYARPMAQSELLAWYLRQPGALAPSVA
jgi:EAL domain-containing protein (putative c-di-GMP-specific phosphodiesterase class I)/DNA-binding response OmpR family regulator